MHLIVWIRKQASVIKDCIHFAVKFTVVMPLFEFIAIHYPCQYKPKKKKTRMVLTVSSFKNIKIAPQSSKLNFKL